MGQLRLESADEVRMVEIDGLGTAARERRVEDSRERRYDGLDVRPFRDEI